MDLILAVSCLVLHFVACQLCYANSNLHPSTRKLYGAVGNIGSVRGRTLMVHP